jgi:signal transduction histidine kinase
MLDERAQVMRLVSRRRRRVRAGESRFDRAAWPAREGRPTIDGRRHVTPMPQPRPRAVRWLYLLVVLPTVTEWLESGKPPENARDLITDVVLTAIVLLLVWIFTREVDLFAAEVRARLAAVEQLRQGDRLSTVGRLAAGLAHELGTPLNVVAGRAKMIASGELAGDEARTSARIIHETAQRMTQLVRELLDFARRRPANPANVAVDELTRHVRQLVEPMTKKKRVTLTVDGADGLMISADVFQMQQALTNLTVNAIEAVAPGGHVTIACRRREAAPPLEHGGPGGEYLCLSVRDDGPGIRDEDRASLFEPFFTTKDVGEGTGLGLPVALGLVQENGGWIAVESTPGAGATFSIFVPLERQAKDAAK